MNYLQNLLVTFATASGGYQSGVPYPVTNACKDKIGRSCAWDDLPGLKFYMDREAKTISIYDQMTRVGGNTYSTPDGQCKCPIDLNGLAEGEQDLALPRLRFTGQETMLVCSRVTRGVTQGSGTSNKNPPHGVASH